MRPQRQGQMRRLKREADELARKPRKTESDRARESAINAQYEQDVQESAREGK